MKRAIAMIAIGLTVSGCATTWITTQAVGKPAAWDEGVREVSVPLPGVQERLAIKLSLVTEYTTTNVSTVKPGETTAPYTGASSVAEPFALACSTEQRARDVVYHSAFRYGKRWKLMTGIMALVEGGLATAFLLSKRDQHPEYVVYGGFFALDAAITAGLFFIPRKEIYRKDEQPIVTHVRSDCPEGMTLAVGADRFPVDAAGRIGEVGEAAIDAWMSAPAGQLQLEVAGQVRTLEVGPGEQCVWQRDHHREQPASCTAPMALRSIVVALDVPVGALTGVAAQ